MKPAVINVNLAWGAACDLVLLVQDAAGVPLDLSGAALDFALKAGDASVPLAVDAADAAEGLVRVRVPGQDLGMFPWEGWLQTSPETPRERILRGLMTVTDKVDSRAEGNPSTHRYFVRLSDAVTVSVDSVDLAWWAYAHALKAQESMESLADAWPETVSEAKQDVHAVKEDALAAIRDKQADAVLAVGRAQKTATDKIAGAQADAVSAVQEAEEEAQGTITPLVQRAETAKEAIDQAEGRINTAATNAATSATSAANSATEAQQALAAIPQVDASGNMTLAGGLTAGGKINANGGMNVPVSPANDNDVVRLVDVSTPANILPLFSQKTVTPMRYLRGSCVTANGVTIATGDTPFVLTNNRVKDSGDDNWMAYGFHTFVLELNPFRFFSNTAYNPEGKSSQQDFGVRANFGLTSSPWESAPDSIFSQIDMNDLLQPIKLHANQWGYCPVASIWPGSASSDFRARVGFQQRRENFNKSTIDTEKLNQYLFACYDRRNIVRIIQVYARSSPVLDPNHSYLFSQNRDGVIQLIGYVYHSYGWGVPCLWMTAHGQCGVQGCWHISQDIFGLIDACKAGWPGGTRPAGYVSWPIQQSVFIAENTGGTFAATITADEKTYTLSDDVPDWISAEAGENSGEITLTVSANDTGAQRDGLVNLTLFNGIMYTIVVRQSA